MGWPQANALIDVLASRNRLCEKPFFDRFFLGATGIHPQHGITVIESDEALILSQMIQHAKQVIAVADSSKLNMISAMKVCSPAQTDLIITDDGAEPEVLEAFRKQNIRILLA